MIEISPEELTELKDLYQRAEEAAAAMDATRHMTPAHVDGINGLEWEEDGPFSAWLDADAKYTIALKKAAPALLAYRTKEAESAKALAEFDSKPLEHGDEINLVDTTARMVYEVDQEGDPSTEASVSLDAYFDEDKEVYGGDIEWTSMKSIVRALIAGGQAVIVRAEQ